MSSDDSDDEPLSSLAAKKAEQSKTDRSTEDEASESSSEDEEVKKNNSYKLRAARIFPPTPLNDRPMDVWLYFKDLTVTGPYSCLLCPEWFINKSKIIIHYILNHKKDYCGICRYFVEDQEHWVLHQRFHCPWVCSQCPETFPSEPDLRVHFSLAHNLVHCRLCSFMVTDNEEYNKHLFKKHNILEIANKDVNYPWEVEYEGSTKFFCLFCSKKILQIDFFRHFMCFHRYTLKCFSTMLSGNEIPFTIHGANLSADFLNAHVANQRHCGYVDIIQKKDEQKIVNDDSSSFIDALIPEIKQEVIGNDDVQEDDSKGKKSAAEAEEDEQIDADEEQKFNDIMSYSGEEIFDITAVEVVVLQDMCRLYVEEVIKEVTEDSLQRKMELDFSLLKNVTEKPLACPICDELLLNIGQFCLHITKSHSVSCVPAYCCRLCLQCFDTEPDYRRHVASELKDFDNLWLCQYCDREFENRKDTREHLKEHLDEMNFDNCHSPHLGFKCRYCPCLFWNETEREEHSRMKHSTEWTAEFYKCCLCSVFYSDKAFFTYHFLQKHAKNTANLVYLLKCMKCSTTTPNIQFMKEHFRRSHPDDKKLFCCLPPCKYKPMTQNRPFNVHKRLVHAQGLCGTGPAPSSTCPVCEREFRNAQACGAHMALAHGPGRFKCKLCNENLHSGDERKLHYMLKHPGHYHFECKLCKKTFQYKSSLYIHRTTVHLKKQELFTCKYCKKEFRKRDSYREHLQIHEGPHHTCSYCPMRFVQRSNMLRHERRHTGERPYSCTLCPRTFSDKGACNAHIKTHNRVAVNQCKYCGQTFVQKSKLKYHIRKHTGEGLETCPICSKIFTCTYYLREHMKTHEGKPGIPCPICQKPFTERGNVIKHVRRVHSTIGQQKCPICQKKLTTMIGLRKHLFTHSRVKPYSCLRCNKSYAIKESMVKHIRKRHKIEGNGDKYYSTLEPKDCDIGLDETLMAAIFGTTKPLSNQPSDDNFVEFPKLDVVVKQEAMSDTETENRDEENNGESSNEEESEEEESSEGNSNKGPEEGGPVEPTNFVTVKLEPMEVEDYDGEE